MALRLFLALPSYDGSRYNGTAVGYALHHRGPFKDVTVEDAGSSLLASNFNHMWARALNARHEGITHFLMVHADVVPHAARWLEALAEVMQRARAEVLSVVIPIKDERGLTSTAIEGPTKWNPRRLTMTELQGQLPTFTHPALLVNTGLLLVDMRRPWVERVHFSINDEMARDDSGRFYARTEPEDWFFSRRAREQGVALYATREIAVTHMGRAGYTNSGAWGTARTNRADARGATAS